MKELLNSETHRFYGGQHKTDTISNHSALYHGEGRVSWSSTLAVDLLLVVDIFSFSGFIEMCTLETEECLNPTSCNAPFLSAQKSQPHMRPQLNNITQLSISWQRVLRISSKVGKSEHNLQLYRFFQETNFFKHNPILSGLKAKSYLRSLQNLSLFMLGLDKG